MPDAIPTITIDMDRRCTRCRRPGAAPNGLCLGCTAITLTEERMAKTKKGHTPGDGDGQDALIPMSEDELKKASRALALAIRDLAVLQDEHAQVRDEQKAERGRVEEKIQSLAASIRSQGR